MKVACMVLTGGKSVRIYLSELGRGLYYGSYKSPRTLTWAIGTIILIVMIATGFMGYMLSPKWPYLTIFSIYGGLSYILANIQELYLEYNIVQNRKNKISINSISMLNNKSLNIFNKREYSTVSSTNNNSERLNIIINELRIKPVFVYEDIKSDNARKQILKDTRDLSGIKWFGKLLICLNLSNSWKALKLLIPSYKDCSGWFNNSCMVIIQWIIEKLIGNQGSKSNKYLFVKEQRVKGRLCKLGNLHRRCTLSSFERNSLLLNGLFIGNKIEHGILSKQIDIIQIRKFTYSKLVLTSELKTVNIEDKNNLNISPWFLTGFIDGFHY